MGTQEKGKLNNAGFSLVELIVTVLLMSMIMGIVMVFISTSRTYYQVVDAEAVLQAEAQAASGYFYDLLLESTDVKTTGDLAATSAGGSVADGAIRVFSIKSSTGYSYIVWEKDNNVLRYCTHDGFTGGSDVTTICENIADAGAIGNRYKLLAEHVTDITLTKELGKSLYKLTLNLNYLGRDYTTTLAVAGRNTLEEDE